MVDTAKMLKISAKVKIKKIAEVFTRKSIPVCIWNRK